MEVESFLNYIDGMHSEDDFVKKLDKEVEQIKGNEEWRREYMTLLMRDQENIEKGREEGIYGMASALNELGIAERVILEKLQEKFQLTEEEAQEYLKNNIV